MTINENRKYYIPACHYSTGLPQEHPQRELVEVDRETYLAYYRPIWRTHDSAIRNGGCNSVSWKLCTGDCPSCRHHLGGRDWSLEAHVEKTGLEVPDPLTDVEAQVLDCIALEELVEHVKELDPEGRRICELVALGMDERKAAQEMGLNKTTYHDRKDRLFARLRKEWTDLI